MPDTKLPPWTRTQERLASPVIRLMTVLNVWAYRLTGGRLGGTFLQGAPVGHGPFAVLRRPVPDQGPMPDS